MEQRSMIYLSRGPFDEVIRLSLGQVLQIAPFQIPLRPPTEDAELDVKLEGGLVLNYIGQSPTPSSGEGTSTLCAFFVAIAEGETQATITLRSPDQETTIPGFRRQYKIVCGSE